MRATTQYLYTIYQKIAIDNEIVVLSYLLFVEQNIEEIFQQIYGKPLPSE